MEATGTGSRGQLVVVNHIETADEERRRRQELGRRGDGRMRQLLRRAVRVDIDDDRMDRRELSARGGQPLSILNHNRFRSAEAAAETRLLDGVLNDGAFDRRQRRARVQKNHRCDLGMQRRPVNSRRSIHRQVRRVTQTHAWLHRAHVAWRMPDGDVVCCVLDGML